MSNANTIHLIRRGPGWVPADEHATEWSQKFNQNEEIVVTRKSVRNPKEVRWFFAMLRKVIENTERFSDTEELREALLIGTGHYRWRRDIYGRLYEVADSFTDMDEDVFCDFKEKALHLIEVELGIDATELMREVDGTQKWVGPLP